jgi:hypothetical protein
MSEGEIDAIDLEEIKRTHLEIYPTVKYMFLRQLEFTGYLIISMFIHISMLVIGKILLTAEWIKNKLVQS